jgi:ABC-type transport system involved in multi-copper enzyme maturation permease subunit
MTGRHTADLRQEFRSIAAIVKAEALSLMRQPVVYVLAAAAAVMIFVSKDVTMFTFDWGAGDDPSYIRTMVREMGLATLFIIGLFLSVLAASRSIYEEIEHKTALAVLSKPVSRPGFIAGKYIGIMLGIAPLFLFLGCVLFITIRFQSVSDIEIGLGEKAVNDFQIFKGVYLNYLKTAVLCAFSVALSTRLAFLPNLMITGAVFMFCHLLNYFNSFFLRAEGLLFYLLQALYSIVLNLENYNYFYQGDPPPLPSMGLIAMVTLYTLIYIFLFLAAASVSFSKRDLY